MVAPAPRASRIGREDIAFGAFAQPRFDVDRYAGALVSPALAAAWARAIGTCWDSEKRAGTFDPGMPLLVMDLAPGDGRFARMLLAALRERLDELGLPGGVLRYIACVEEHVDAGRWIDETGLADDDAFDVVVWDPSRHRRPPSATLRRGYRWPVQGNTVAVVAAGYLQRYPGDLCGVHEGQWLEGRVHELVAEDDMREVEYVWRSPATNAGATAALRQRYLRVLGSACVTVPGAGLRALRTIALATSGRFLWLAVDHGVDSERRIRLGELTPPARWTDEGAPLPVNFHALCFDQAALGAWSQHRQIASDGVMVQVIWRHDGMSYSGTEYARLSSHLDVGHPDDIANGRYLATALDDDASPSLRLSLLRLCSHAPEVLAPVLEAWCATPPALDALEREAWCAALEKVWANASRAPSQASFRQRLAVLATHWFHFGLARAIFAFDNIRHGLAFCDAATGRAESALRLLETSARTGYAVELHAHVRTTLDRWRALGWYRADIARDGELAIEPLGVEHAEAMFAQYRDPQIGVLTRLPDFESPDAVKDWIEKQAAESGRMTYALQHIAHGFVGVVSLHAGEGEAYFYFWTGCDHQGKGYGRRAARLLCAQAEAQGMFRLFTSVYPDNRRSRDALRAMGFVELTARALSPDDDLVFMVREASGPVGMGQHEARLASLLAALGSPITLATVAMSGSADIVGEGDGDE